MKKTIIAVIAALVTVLTVNAEECRASGCGDLSLVARVGYSIGGTAPLPMPAEIRKLNSFTPQASISAGVDLVKNWNRKWGTLVGVRVENKGMREDANVKNYYMELTKGGESISGNFTGDEVTYVKQWMVTVPVLATLTVNKVMLKCGPYASAVFNREFSGWAHNGYLRVDDPTGEKIMIGEGPDERGDYDFSENMRDVQLGVMLGADWHLSKRWGLYADISWGLTGVFKGDFKTIEQTLYPIYGTIGVTYRIR
ncbi:MAG: PorT family protein [Muribaculaceae bacterium]|nr:PorT family protein [Muribaculaceae bacterium]